MILTLLECIPVDRDLLCRYLGKPDAGANEENAKLLAALGKGEDVDIVGLTKRLNCTREPKPPHGFLIIAEDPLPRNIGMVFCGLMLCGCTTKTKVLLDGEPMTLASVFLKLAANPVNKT
jgi:hypothetical protein